MAIAALALPTADAMMRFGKSLAPLLAAGDVIALSGELGAGKTVLAKGVITAGFEAGGMRGEDIPSPTFTLVQEYPFCVAGDKAQSATAIRHIDLWRITDAAQEIPELGLEDGFARHISLIEWPERLMGVLALPEDALLMRIEIGDDETSGEDSLRRLILTAASGGAENIWRERLAPVLADSGDVTLG